MLSSFGGWEKASGQVTPERSERQEEPVCENPLSPGLPAGILIPGQTRAGLRIPWHDGGKGRWHVDGCHFVSDAGMKVAGRAWGTEWETGGYGKGWEAQETIPEGSLGN